MGGLDARGHTTNMSSHVKLFLRDKLSKRFFDLFIRLLFYTQIDNVLLFYNVCSLITFVRIQGLHFE